MNRFNKIQLFTIVILTMVWLSSCNQTSTAKDGKTTETKADNQNDELISTDVVSNTSEITFDKDTYDFGEIKEGDVIHYDFKFTNTGDHDLIISSARGSCGCTVPDWPKEPIKPGASNVIKVQFNSKGKKGAQNKTVTIVANTKPSETTIYIKGVVLSAE